MANVEDLIAQPYAVLMWQEQTTSGIWVWVAWHPEFDWQGVHRCISQGSTRQEALDNLDDARRSFITSLVEDRLVVPRPWKHSARADTIVRRK